MYQLEVIIVKLVSIKSRLKN